MTCYRHRNRNGSALLLCTLAAAVLSMATIAIVRSNRRSIARVDGVRASIQGQCVAEGLMQRSIAVLRSTPTFSGVIEDKGAGLSEAFAQVTVRSASVSEIEVHLYRASKTPALIRTLDPAKL